jgi:hypothetical protein
MEEVWMGPNERKEMKRNFWGIWSKQGILIDSLNRPLIFIRLLDAKLWMLNNPTAKAEIIKCHINERS